MPAFFLLMMMQSLLKREKQPFAVFCRFTARCFWKTATSLIWQRSLLMVILIQMEIMLITWELSQRRSLAVAQYLLEIQGEFLTSDQTIDLQDYLTVNGHSMANPILDADGNVDKDASRRVEVKFRLKDDEMIDELSSIMTTDQASSDNAQE